MITHPAARVVDRRNPSRSPQQLRNFSWTEGMAFSWPAVFACHARSGRSCHPDRRTSACPRHWPDFIARTGRRPRSGCRTACFHGFFADFDTPATSATRVASKARLNVPEGERAVRIMRLYDRAKQVFGSWASGLFSR